MASRHKNPDPKGVKGGAQIDDLARGSTTCKQEDAAPDDDTEDSPWPTAAPLSHWPASNQRPANNDPLPDFKDQVRGVPAAVSASNQPNANNNNKNDDDPLPNFKDQVRNATPPPQGDPQQPEPQAAVLGGNGQEPTFVELVPGIPIDDSEALDGGGDRALAAGGGGANHQTTTTGLRKHMIWGAVVFGLGTVVVVAVVVTLNNNSGGGGPTGVINPPPVPPPTLAAPAQTVLPIAAPSHPVNSPTETPQMATLVPTGSPPTATPTTAPVVEPTIVESLQNH